VRRGEVARVVGSVLLVGRELRPRDQVVCGVCSGSSAQVADAAVASKGGAPEHPAWYANLVANPVIDLMDGTRTTPMRARELSGQERDLWWVRAVAAYPPYADYQAKTERTIPLFVLEPLTD
jgi:deazaflavin-dependent oxidoreductase (nitroreductase family)